MRTGKGLGERALSCAGLAAPKVKAGRGELLWHAEIPQYCDVATG